MSKDINLAGKIEKVGFPHERVILLRKIAVIVAISTSILAILIFFISIQFSLSSAQTEEGKINSQLFIYQKKISEARLLNDRLAQIRTITSERDSKFSKIDKIVSQKPESVSLDSLDIEEKSIVISFKSPSLSDISQLVESLKKTKFEPSEKIKISELKLLPGVGYTLSITIE